MKNSFKGIFTLILVSILAFSFGGCTRNTDKDDDTDPIITNEHTFVGEFTVYSNEDKAIAGPYASVFAAIDELGLNGSADYYIKDESNKKFFIRGNRNILHMITKDKYYGSTIDFTAADKFLAETPYSHIITGTAGKYYGHSVTRMNGETQTIYGYEPESGSYVYQFSANGYVKASTIVRLSEVKYRMSQNPNIKGNVYIFINSNGAGGACDLGIMCGDGHNGKFYAVTNGFEHPLALPYRDEPISEMVYDAEKNEYSGADDIYMEYTIDASGVHMLIRNLRTNVEQRFSEAPSEGSLLAEKYATSWMNRTMLHATSYCPVTDARKIWDPLNGGYFLNAVYEDLQIWKYNETVSQEWYPSSLTTKYGFVYADDGASYQETTVNNKKQVIHNIFYTQERY
jgi:hypothetical protein